MFDELEVLLLLFVFFCIAILMFLLFFYSYQSRRNNVKRWLVKSSEKNIKSVEAYSVFGFALDAITTSKDTVSTKFIEAGIYNTKLASYYMLLKYSVLIMGIGGILLLKSHLSNQITTLVAIGAIWSVFIIVAPDSYLSLRAKKHQKNISDQLPYMIDLLAVCVQTGMTIEASFSYLSKELSAFNKDLGYLMNKTNDRTKLVGLGQALEELYKRVPTSEMRSFVMTLNQSLQYGSSIYIVLTTLSADIREVQLLRVEEGVGKLSARMSIPLILFIMFPIVVLVAVPGVMRALNG